MFLSSTLFAVPAFSQTTFGSITGVVTDPGGAVGPREVDFQLRMEL